MDIPAETNNGEVTSWVPLDGVFTPSSGCESVFRMNGPSLVAFDPGYGLDIDTAVKCAPSAVTTWWEQARLGVGGGEHTAVSIQPITCPDEWTTVATYQTDSSTTQVMCCPSGYSLNGATAGPVNGDCVSDISSGATLTYAFTSGTATRDWSTATTTMEDSSSVGAIAVVGYNVERAVSTSSSDRSSGSASESTSDPSNTTGSSTSSPTADSGGLSTGAKAGIGIGVSLGVIGIIALVVAFVMFRRRSKKQLGGPLPGGVENKPVGVGQHNPHEYVANDRFYELHDNGRVHAQELPHTGEPRSPVEIGSYNR